jgi:hypothetical protein
VPAASATPPAPAPAVDLPAPEGRARGGSTQKIVGLSIAAAGLVGVGVGAALGLSARSKLEDAKPLCAPGFASCTRAGLEVLHSARTTATWSTVAFVGGGVLIAGGIVVFATATGDRKAVGLRACVGRGEASAAIEGVF